jgi:hypothetical protein
MGCRIYEADKDGRITIYPSLNGPSRKSSGILKTLISKMMGTERDIGKNNTRIQKV